VIGLFLCLVWPKFPTPDVLPWTINLLVLTIYSFVAYFCMTVNAHSPVDGPPRHSPQTVHVDTDDIDVFVNASGSSRLTDQQVLTFAGCIVAPREYFVRISEHVETYHRSTLIRSVFTLRIYDPELSAADHVEDSVGTVPPNAALSGYVIPLFVPEKGQLTDGLRVFDGGGKRISTIDTRTQNAFIAASMRFLIKYASMVAFNNYLANERAVELLVLELLTGSTPKLGDVEDAQKAIAELDGNQDAAEMLQLASELMGELASHRPISVGVTKTAMDAALWPATQRFTLERRLVASIEEAPYTPRFGKSARFSLDGLRLALGVRLNRVFFPVDAAYRTDSYHLEVEGPPGTYFARGNVIEPVPLGQLEYQSRDQTRRGQRRSHTYIRSMAGTPGSYYGAQFFERSPGSFASASVSSLVSSVLIVALAIMVLAPVTKSDPDRTPIILTALLALPIAASAFLGLDKSEGRRHPSLLSRAISLWTTVISLTALILALVRESRPMDPAGWHLLMWASVATTTIAFTSWCIRLTTETRFFSGSAAMAANDLSEPGGEDD